MSTRISSFRSGTIASVLVSALAAGFALAQTPSTLPIPSPTALRGLDAYQAVELGNAWKGSDVTVFATGEALVFTFQDGQEVAVPMPSDEMLVSVAPYLNRTHPCSTHYLSGCQGELVGAPVGVRATLADGTVVIDETVTSGANGFLDLWLPREEGILIELTLDGYAAQGFVTTYAGSPTCVTTLRLTPRGS